MSSADVLMLVVLAGAALFMSLAVVWMRRSARRGWCAFYTEWLYRWKQFAQDLTDKGYAGDPWLTEKIAEEQRGVEKWCKR